MAKLALLRVSAAFKKASSPQEAGSSHDYRPKDETYESWTALHDTPDWSRYE